MHVALRSRGNGVGTLARVCVVFVAAAIAGMVPVTASAQNLQTNGSFDDTNGTAGSAWTGCIGCWKGSSYTLTQQLDGGANNSINTATGGLDDDQPGSQFQ